MAETSTGLLNSLIWGVGGLIISLILIFVMVQTVNTSNLLGADDTLTITTTNESGGYINATGYQLGTTYNSSRSSFAILQAWNATDGLLLTSGNYTVNSTGFVTNATATTWADVNFTYTYVFTYTNDEQLAANNLAGNFTTGVSNISSKVPTILLIAAIVVLLTVIVLLTNRTRQMNTINSSGTL